MTAPSSDSTIKTVLFLTGTRADFGKLKPLMQCVDADSAFACKIFATGMHTLQRYGNTVVEIDKCNFSDVFRYMNQMDHTSSDMDMVLASTIQGLGHYIRENRPDLLVVHGDRVEAMAGAIVGALNNVLVCHIEGGEVSGTIDEHLRHAISKLAHLHLVANDEASQRLIQMGERPETVSVIGSPDLDVMFSDNLPALDEVKAYYSIPFDDYGIFMFHPVTTDLHGLVRRVDGVMDALKESNWNIVAFYPNNDTGSEVILEAVEALRDQPNFHVLPSMRFEYFLTLLRNARAIIGNSSAGMREAPAYSVPTINIGSRQNGRHSHSSIVNVSEARDAILEAMGNLPTADTPSLHFGEGNSAELFMQRLRSPDFWLNDTQKVFRDLDHSTG